jgi:uncharacterized protein (TIGR02231 family)
MKKETVLTLLIVVVASMAKAQPSRIEQVLVYPGGATVERRVAVKTGQKLLQLTCLPARFDANSLQLLPEAGINLGEISVQTVARTAAPDCARSPLDTSIRELEDQIAAVNAEASAHELALGYLKQIGSGEKGSGGSIPATADTLRRSGLDSLQKLLPLQRRKDELTLQLTPLRAERDRLAQANPQLRTVTVRLSAARDAELRLSYRLTQQAGWEPIYRAYLDTATGQVRLERHAQVAQSSGEDWSGVTLRLSTAQPRQTSGTPAPRPWTLDLLPPVNVDSAPRPSYAAMAAPALVEARAGLMREDAAAGPSFDVSVFQGEFATEFEVPGKVNIAADGQRVALSLGSVQLDSQLMARSNPSAEAQAYLVAEATPPGGVWPNGALQLFRDGAFIGQSSLAIANKDKLDLYFGRDELLRVSVDAEQRNAGATGFIGSRAEQKIAHVYRLENLHQRAITVQVLEPSPVARHEDIKVISVFDPKPDDSAWRKQPGVVAWRFTLQPSQVQKLSAGYEISYPKDARIGGMR